MRDHLPPTRFGLACRALLGALALSALPVVAQDRMDAAAFDAYTQGKTFHYGAGGEAYGVEEYLPDRRVRWSFLDGDCKDGRWYEEAGNICFVYDDMGAPQCWSFFLGAQGMTARFENSAGPTTELYEVRSSQAPMLCHGPEVGV
ncbi:hypothetical protein [Pseudooceanicola aestuarii]|uniref:hypothetical protein n=1 Tax=Pseudooceanicola aestuarii TaxID=2697319 RepID=UPI0013D8DA46|nr:hypothetical protein [Pseudooceanicola aestuarii]